MTVKGEWTHPVLWHDVGIKPDDGRAWRRAMLEMIVQAAKENPELAADLADVVASLTQAGKVNE